MYVVIFRATINELDGQYSLLASKLRTRAISEYGCIDFSSTLEGDQEIAVSYWPNREAIHRWANDTEHRAAQRLGRERWYKSVSVEVAEVLSSR